MKYINKIKCLLSGILDRTRKFCSAKVTFAPSDPDCVRYHDGLVTMSRTAYDKIYAQLTKKRRDERMIDLQISALEEANRKWCERNELLHDRINKLMYERRGLL